VKVDENTTVAALCAELARLGVHSLSMTKHNVHIGGDRVAISAGFDVRFTYATGHDEVETFGKLLGKIEQGIADEMKRGDAAGKDNAK
jgi:hypothetical protein